MHKLTRRAVYAAIIPLTAAAAVAVDPEPASADPTASERGAVVPLTTLYRLCDSSVLQSVYGAAQGDGSASAVVRATGGTVVADVHLVDTYTPSTHYDVGLIQVPRPTLSPCGPGDPGTTFGSLDTDEGGRASTTLKSSVGPATTGVWLVIQRPSEHSQLPGVYYSSGLVRV